MNEISRFLENLNIRTNYGGKEVFTDSWYSPVVDGDSRLIFSCYTADTTVYLVKLK